MACVRCIDCGFLAVRRQEDRALCEVEDEIRTQGKWPTSNPGRNMHATYEEYPICFVGAARLSNEKVSASFQGVIQKERDCREFIEWRRGSSPKEHEEMRLAEQMKQLEMDRKKADEERAEERRHADKEWQAKQEAENRERQEARDRSNREWQEAQEQARREREDRRDKETREWQGRHNWMNRIVQIGLAIFAVAIGAIGWVIGRHTDRSQPPTTPITAPNQYPAIPPAP